MDHWSKNWLFEPVWTPFRFLNTMPPFIPTRELKPGVPTGVFYYTTLWVPHTGCLPSSLFWRTGAHSAIAASVGGQLLASSRQFFLQPPAQSHRGRLSEHPLCAAPAQSCAETRHRATRCWASTQGLLSRGAQRVACACHAAEWSHGQNGLARPKKLRKLYEVRRASTAMTSCERPL